MSGTTDKIAKARIDTLILTARTNAIKTGGDPADAVFELPVAAAEICDQHQIRNGVAEAFSRVVPSAIACAANSTCQAPLTHPRDEKERT
ncbi:hypothetical protein F8A10_12235 [Paracoccus kondratievae]|uniref:Uncharacterized protein n=1 Tax=Paracoccus kondratievae TaxID=135740 RepID=A0AAD3NZ63_9RHOB|nr:hypothetical protein [Paracoccus kondratievae]QFQ88278.1 hypothetical protein F8A10_12235 [Paracoccus kondratievae]GLK65261.1 hypothetical protein GCM10017635_27350 [Paracoccus kondratievae]